jgi:hypothetical protein
MMRFVLLPLAAARTAHLLQIQSLQARLVQASAEVRQLQLLSDEREQSARALKLQLDAALSCDAEREAHMSSALAAAAALQEERAALQLARNDAVLQSSRAAVAAEEAALVQSNHRAASSPIQSGYVAEMQQCVSYTTPLLLRLSHAANLTRLAVHSPSLSQA